MPCEWEINEGGPAQGSSDSAPEGYKRLPSGVRCRCMRSWLGTDGYFWCCNPKSQAKEPEASGGLCGEASHAVRVGEASADLPTTSEHMDVTAGETALLPCPFCGSSNVHDLPKYDWVACQDCGAQIEDGDPSARELWNQRAERRSPAESEPVISRGMEWRSQPEIDDDVLEGTRAALRKALNKVATLEVEKADLVNKVLIYAHRAEVASQSQPERCAKCGTPLRGEAALVDGQEWCHPCADERAQPDIPAARADEASDLVKLAAECHRAKWAFQIDEEAPPRAHEARQLVIKAFDELHRIGNMARKMYDEARRRSQPVSERQQSEMSASTDMQGRIHNLELRCSALLEQRDQLAAQVERLTASNDQRGNDLLIVIAQRDASDALVERAHKLLRGMLIDPIATLDEPDADGEVILKYRRTVKAYFASLSSTVLP